MERGKTFTFKGTGKIFAYAYNRVCIGGQGPYIEFELEHLNVQLETQPGQEYRGEGRYLHCKYFWLRPIGGPDIKVYHQRGIVSYADYKRGKYYVSPDDLEWEGGLYAEVSNSPNPTTISPTTYRKENK